MFIAQFHRFPMALFHAQIAEFVKLTVQSFAVRRFKILDSILGKSGIPSAIDVIPILLFADDGTCDDDALSLTVRAVVDVGVVKHC